MSDCLQISIRLKRPYLTVMRATVISGFLTFKRLDDVCDVLDFLDVTIHRPTVFTFTAVTIKI